ncbi:hypothetical protein [Halorubrum sp. C191]|uniref:hypothetical protein n=1 Tax=Halorubrum sp. C191 TaxID=1383842 RepID=UPI001181A4FD|nr:hypothetical protein [Halorubrum sp. C191]
MDDGVFTLSVLTILLLTTLPASALVDIVIFVLIGFVLLGALSFGILALQDYYSDKGLMRIKEETRKEQVIREMYADGLMTERQLEEALDDVVVGDGQEKQNEEQDLIPQRN